MTIKQLDDIVYNFPTKHKMGYTTSDKKKLLEKHFSNISLEQLGEAIGVVTVTAIEGETVTYHDDIYYALRKLVLNKPMNAMEWD